MTARPYTVVFPPQPEGAAAEERIEVRWANGRVERLALHEYGRLYAVPGLYDAVVQEALACATPDRLAAMLAGAARELGLAPDEVRILDAGAGSGASGAAQRAHGLRPVIGLDLEPAARTAALRDRPGLYSDYHVADLTALTAAQERAIRAAAPNALAMVGAVGGGHLPPAAVRAATHLLAPPGLVAYGYDPALGPDPLAAVMAGARVLARERYVHRRSAAGGHRDAVGIVALAGPAAPAPAQPGVRALRHDRPG